MTTRIIRLDYKGMQDIILMPDKDDMVQIWTIINEHGFIFDKFTLVIEPLKTTFKIHIEGKKDNQIIHMKRIWKDREGLSHTENRDLTIDKMIDQYADLMRQYSSVGLKAALGNEKVDLLMPFHFIQYVIYSDIHRQVEYIESKDRPGKSSSKRSSNKTTREYSLTECIKIYHTKNKNRSYTRKTAQWERRGGIRHLKSGKIVPYSGSTCHAKNKAVNPTDDTTTKNYRL